MEAQTKTLAATCAPITGDNTVATDVSNTPQDYLDIFLNWSAENQNYDFITSTCTPTGTCNEFMTVSIKFFNFETIYAKNDGCE